MKTLNTNELEEVAGGFPFIAMPAIIAVLPKPSFEPVVREASGD